jgi:hypothetical protein
MPTEDTGHEKLIHFIRCPVTEGKNDKSKCLSLLAALVAGTGISPMVHTKYVQIIIEPVSNYNK